MINRIENLAYLLILFLPLSLITGNAFPDISITFVGLIFISLFFFKKKFPDLFTHKWILISFVFWFFLIFISLFSENKNLAYRDALIFIRITLIPIFIYIWILRDENRIKKKVVAVNRVHIARIKHKCLICILIPNKSDVIPYTSQ